MKSMQSHLLFFLLWLPLLPLVFVKTSLPPHAWDEAVYHYISPQVLETQQVWHFRSLYSNLPRTLETAFTGLFSLTSTYATARILHFAIYFSFSFAFYYFLRKSFSKPAAALVILTLNFLLPHLVFESTLGYIDLATTSFILTTWLIVIYAYQDKSITFELLFIYSGLAVGAKYNALPAVAVAILFYILSLAKRFRKTYIKRVPVYLGLSTLFGGYWYLKNWLITGNPIFPFLFGCKQDLCSQGQSFFDWAEPMGLANLPAILSQLFYSISRSGYLFLSLLLLGIIFSKKSVRKIFYLSLCLFFIEYLIISRFAGFTLRYFYHWQIILWTLGVLSGLNILIFISKLITPQVTATATVLLFMLAFLFSAKFLIPEYRSHLPSGDKYFETRFALHRMSVENWILAILPKTGPAIIWCEKQNQPLTLTVIDPDLLWSTSETKYTVYLDNCRHREDFDPLQPRKLLISAQACLGSGSTPPVNRKDDDRIAALRKSNYDLVCQSHRIVSGLYQVSQ